MLPRERRGNLSAEYQRNWQRLADCAIDSWNADQGTCWSPQTGLDQEGVGWELGPRNERFDYCPWILSDSSGLGESDHLLRLHRWGWGRERKYQAWVFWVWIPRTFSISIVGKAWGQDQLWIHSFLLHTEVLCEYWVLLWWSKNTLQLWSEINCFVERTVYFDNVWGVLVRKQCLLGISLAGVMKLIFWWLLKQSLQALKKDRDVLHSERADVPRVRPSSTTVNNNSVHFLWKVYFRFLESRDGERCGRLASTQLCFANWM